MDVYIVCTALHLPIKCLAWSQLYCTALHCTALHCTALHCTGLLWTALYCTVLHCTALHCTALCWTVLYCTALYCSYQLNTSSLGIHCSTDVCIHCLWFIGTLFAFCFSKKFWNLKRSFYRKKVCCKKVLFCNWIGWTFIWKSGSKLSNYSKLNTSNM
jgi:hypothetical protein